MIVHISEMAPWMAVLLGWVPPCVVGSAILGILRARERNHFMMPVLGYTILGFAGYLSLFTSIPYAAVIGILLLVSTVVVLFQCRVEPVTSGWAGFATLYYLLLFFIAATPFPLLSSWSGDWLENIRLGKVVFEGQLPQNLMGRTPLFAATGVWLNFLAPPLISAQVGSAGVAAACLLAFALFYKSVFRAELPRVVLYALAMGAPVLSHAAFLWAKLLAAACVLLALALCASPQGSSYCKRSLAAAAFWMASAIAAHQAMFLFVALCLVLLWEAGGSFRERRENVVRFVIYLGAWGLVLVAGYEVWSLLQHGLEAKIANNPAVYYRKNEPIWWTTLKVLVGTFVPSIQHARGILALWFSALAEKDVWSLACSSYSSLVWWMDSSSGTLMLAMLPVFLAFCSRTGQILRGLQDSCSRHSLLLGATVGLVLLHSMLIPYASPLGNLQNGLVPLYFLAAAFWIRKGMETYPAGAWGVFWWSFILQGLPWFALNMAVSVMLYDIPRISHKMWSIFYTFEDDTRQYLKLGSPSLADFSDGTAALVLLFLFGLFFFRLELSQRRPTGNPKT